MANCYFKIPSWHKIWLKWQNEREFGGPWGESYIGFFIRSDELARIDAQLHMQIRNVTAQEIEAKAMLAQIDQASFTGEVAGVKP